MAASSIRPLKRSFGNGPVMPGDRDPIHKLPGDTLTLPLKLVRVRVNAPLMKVLAVRPSNVTARCVHWLVGTMPPPSTQPQSSLGKPATPTRAKVKRPVVIAPPGHETFSGPFIAIAYCSGFA